MPPITDINFAGDDDTLGGGPAKLLIAPTSSGPRSLMTLAAAAAPATTQTLVAQLFDDGMGDSILGYASGVPLGSLTPNTVNGHTIATLGDATGLFVIPPLGNGFLIVMTGVVPQNAFTSVTINGFTLFAATATYVQGANANWNWIGTFVLGGLPGTYTVTFN